MATGELSKLSGTEISSCVEVLLEPDKLVERHKLPCSPKQLTMHLLPVPIDWGTMCKTLGVFLFSSDANKSIRHAWGCLLLHKVVLDDNPLLVHDDCVLVLDDKLQVLDDRFWVSDDIVKGKHTNTS